MKHKIAMIVEGNDYEIKIVNQLKKTFFNKQIEVISLPADQNIYMLWKRIKEYGDNIDVIEVIRETSTITKEKLKGYKRDDFSEIYLFLDLDKHQNNLPKKIDSHSVVLEMLDLFNNETENGKLYISYPMAESLVDYRKDGCLTLSNNCYESCYNKNYKLKVNNIKYVKQVDKLNAFNFKDILNCYIKRLPCLFNTIENFDINLCKEYSPIMIYHQQNKLIETQNIIFILSALPEFCIDYFNSNYLNRFLFD